MKHGTEIQLLRMNKIKVYKGNIKFFKIANNFTD